MEKDKLLKLLQKTKFSLLKFPKITSAALLIIVFSVVSVFAQEENLEKNLIIAKSEIKSSPTLIPVTPAPTIKIITPMPTPQIIFPTQAPPPFPTVVPTSAPQSESSLLTAVNAFRNANGVSPLASSESLCQIALKRLDELIAHGSLDNHAGFNKFFSSQAEFNAMGEVIFQSSAKQPPEYAINEGWAKSTAGHRENLLDPKWNFGCGAANGYFFVFYLGKK
ncbi:MAG: CAP domain-containing protein [Candidatus Levybacteria bacterium]|nr:CAP domain-containing protein [Candidatus Levybacteria bacterium]